MSIATVLSDESTEMVYLGVIMGTTYEWENGADHPYVVVREMNSAELIKCYYNDKDYDQIARLFGKKTAIVVIQGTIAFNRVTQKSELTQAKKFDFAPEFSDEDFRRFFGCAPKMTGQIGAAEFISRGRANEH